MDTRPSSTPWMESGREAGLVLSAQGGELSALLELLRHYERPLWRVCLALTRDAVDAELMIEETARRAQRNLRQFRVGQPFYPWLVRQARAIAIANAKRRANDPPVPAVTRPNGEPWENSLRGPLVIEYEQRLLEAFGNLPPDDQLTLALRLFERLPYADIATLAELPPSAVVQRIASLRERLEQGGERKEKAA